MLLEIGGSQALPKEVLEGHLDGLWSSHSTHGARAAIKLATGGALSGLSMLSRLPALG